MAFTSPAKRLQFVSGADEKIVRVFDAPKLWVQTLKALSGVDAGDAVSLPFGFLWSPRKGAHTDQMAQASRPMAANIPPLGLSNRAVACESDSLYLLPVLGDAFVRADLKIARTAPDEAAKLAPASTDVFDEILPVNFTVSDHPPFEEQLLGSMLWPEVRRCGKSDRTIRARFLIPLRLCK